MVSDKSPSFCHEVYVHIYKTVEAVTAGLTCYGGGKGHRESTKLGQLGFGTAVQPVCKLPGGASSGRRDAAAQAERCRQ